LNVRRGTIPSLDEVEEARTNVFFEKIRGTLDAKNFKPHDRMIDRLLDQGYASTDICSALIHLLQGSENKTPDKKVAAVVPAAPGRKMAVGTTAATAPAPSWAKGVAERVQQPAPAAPVKRPAERNHDDEERPTKKKYERPARTGQEAGMSTLFLNVGRKQLVTPADIVGKISGVTRLSADVVGAIDIHQRHTLVDVAEAEAPLIVKKLTGIKMKGVALSPALTSEDSTPAG
jgi:ATP-dependent RNA helicase DeaD